MGGGVGLMLIVILNSLLWGLASFRTERAPDTVLALHDLAWILFTMPAGPLGFQLLSVGIVALGDNSPRPIFPRWFGFLSIWGCLLTMTGYLVIFFKSGPFAWNGLLSFWMPAVVIGIWSTCLIILMLRGVTIQKEAAAFA